MEILGDLFELFFTMAVIVGELIGIYILCLFIQLIFYRLFNINLYKIINKKIDEILK